MKRNVGGFRRERCLGRPPRSWTLKEGKTACYLPDPSASRAISAMRSTIKVPRGWSRICKRSDTLLAAISKSANGRGIDRRDAASSINQRRIVALSTPNPSANHDCHADRPLYWTPRYDVAPMRARSDAEPWLQPLFERICPWRCQFMIRLIGDSYLASSVDFNKLVHSAFHRHDELHHQTNNRASLRKMHGRPAFRSETLRSSPDCPL